MAKSFGLISKNARNKAAEQGTKTLKNNDPQENDSDFSTQLEPALAEGTSPTDPTPLVSLATESDKQETVVSQPEAAVTPGAESLDTEPLPPITLAPVSAMPETAVSETPVQSANTSKKGGKTKKKSDSPVPSVTPLNAARVSRRAHMLLNMISSLENKTQSEIIDELIVLHPLYPKLKSLVEAVG